MPTKTSILFSILSPVVKTAISLLDRSRLPQIQGQLTLKGLQAPVQVLRDRWYVPHILAQSAQDAVFAQGFVHAQERLWQMDFNRRVVAGRLSEVLGEGALMPDRVMRTLGLRRVAEQEARMLPEKIRVIAEAYCAGVNAWIDLAIRKHKLPIEFTLLGYRPEPWVPADILGVPKLMSWTLAGNWEAEFMRQKVIDRLGPENAGEFEMDREHLWAAILDAAPPSLDPTHAFTGIHAGEGAGSNNWVVHGTRTMTGMPLLANDMHLELSAPAIWFENHLSGGNLEVSGITLPGTFLITAGHNRNVAWGFTDGVNDVQDLYEEHLRRTPEGKVEYEFQGEWLPAEVRREEIHVKGKPAVLEEVIITRHGPIINLLVEKDFPGTPPLALCWTALEPETTMQALHDMAFACDCTELHQALPLFSGPGQNTVYADTQGNIGYTLSGRTPIRAKGSGLVPVPGWMGEYEWTGYIPHEEMPHLKNPAKGYVATANNAHTREDDGHYITRDYAQSDRAARIVELIEQKQKLDIPYMQKMHYDLVSHSARVLASYLGSLKFSEVELQEIVREFARWDGKVSPDSSIATIYEATIRRAIRLMLDAYLGDLGVRVQGKGIGGAFWGSHTWEWFIRLLDRPASPWFDQGHGERRDDVLRLAMRQGVDDLKRQCGGDRREWAWGKLHRLTFRHILGAAKPLDSAFNLGSYPIGGDGTTINASFVNLTDLEVGSMGGPPFRFIANLGDLDHCLGMLTPGQSGHPASPHYRDGIRPWFEGSYHPMLINRSEIDKNLSARLDLQTG